MTIMQDEAPVSRRPGGEPARPQALREARARHKKGELPAAALREIEDRSIAEAARKQESIGLQAVTDGEFRRETWHLDFLKELTGVGLRGRRA